MIKYLLRKRDLRHPLSCLSLFPYLQTKYDNNNNIYNYCNNNNSYIALYPIHIYELAALYIINIKIDLTIKKSTSIDQSQHDENRMKHDNKNKKTKKKTKQKKHKYYKCVHQHKSVSHSLKNVQVL